LVLDVADAVQDGVDAVGVVLPGIVDERMGTGVWSENIGWRDVPFDRLLRERVGVPLAVGHDVRAWGLAEHRLGAARGHDDAAVVVVGTGIAVALIVDGHPLRGRGFAGEIGHLRVAASTPCACGGFGCLEAVASGAGIARLYAEVVGRPVSGAEEVADAVRRGEPAAVEVWETALDRLAVGMAALVAVTAPEVVVLGGGLARAGEDLLFAPLRRRLDDRIRYGPVPALLPTAFNGTGGLVGAALLAADHLEVSR